MNKELIERIKNTLDNWDTVAAPNTTMLGLLRDCKAALTQQQEAEPVVYQGRMRPGWDERGIWAQWENCSKGTFEDYKRVPINCDWHFESRALYEHPPKPAAQLQVPEGCEWVYTDEDDDYGTQCGRWFQLNDGTPEDNRMKYCPYCGGKLEVPSAKEGN